MFTFKLSFSVLLNTAIFASLLFLPAGTWHWPRAWAFLGVVFVLTVVSMISAFRDNEGLLNERFKPPLQKGQPLADKIIIIPFIVSFFGLLLFIPLDVFRFHLLQQPDIFVSALGLFLFVAGWTIITLALRENRFASPVVKHQEERHQTVIDTGVYRIVRHPMYAAVIPLLVGMSLWLQSTAAALLAIVPTGLLVLRIVFEERFLRRELHGYDAYTKRVRYRLIPFVW